MAASEVRGRVTKDGRIEPIVLGYAKKRLGPRRTDGKSWKAGEDGCPNKPNYIPPTQMGPPLANGDRRLKRIHFVHVPKSGGTSFGQVVIAAACELNSRWREYLDCCAPPADWCSENCEPVPMCAAVYGCSLCHCHHIPRLQRMGDAHYSITILRHPMTRYVSGYFYRAHSPNWDRFNVRPSFYKDPVYPFVYSFDDYLEMPEYQNIFVKMFALNKFPYFNYSISQKEVNLALSKLSGFALVGVNEAYDASVQLLLRMLDVRLRDDQVHLPPAMSSTYADEYMAFKENLKTDGVLQQRIMTKNWGDAQLYEWAVSTFCSKLCSHSDIIQDDKYGVCKGTCPDSYSK